MSNLSLENSLSAIATTSPLWRWYQLRYHWAGVELEKNPVRFPIVPAGRRSGKTERAKRHIAREAITTPTEWPINYYFAAAPIRDQAKKIYWEDLKAFTKPYWVKPASESNLIIYTGYQGVYSEIHIVGMDKPARIEGQPWNGGILDEYADMKPTAFTENVRPALSDRNGFCWLIGVPEGRNHYYEVALKACDGIIPQAEPGRGVIKISKEDPEFGFYHWHSADILRPKEIASNKRLLDSRTFRQEFEASFESYQGAMYYAFNRDLVNDEIASWNPDAPLWLTCDFNKSPMVFEVVQRQGNRALFIDEIATAFHAKTKANTYKFIEKYKHASNKLVYVTGDASGKYEDHKDHTTDYFIIRDELKSHGWEVVFKVPNSNPSINNRVNIFNAKMETETVFFNSACEYLVGDMEKVEGDGKGGKNKTDPMRTHASDAGDYILFDWFAPGFYANKVKQ